MSDKLLVKNIRQLVAVGKDRQLFIRGKENYADISIFEGTLEDPYNFTVDVNGKISSIFRSSEKTYDESSAASIVDAEFKVVIPGLVDSHTHPVWDGDRVHEFAMKLEGASYMDIHNIGGGIHYTCRATKAAKQETLEQLLLDRLNQMLSLGSTTVECKSGYGLEIETELKMLRTIHAVKAKSKQRLTSTYLGPHAIPQGKNSQEQTEIIIRDHFKALKNAIDENQISVDQIDAFCETGVFSVEQTKAIFKAAREQGLSQSLNVHVDELTALGGAEAMAVLENCRALSHLEECSDEGVKAMSENDVAAVLLPTTALQLKLSKYWDQIYK